MTPVRILAVGLPGSGKTHFIRIATSDPLSEGEKNRPAFGVYESGVWYRRRRLAFSESSIPLQMPAGQTRLFDVVMWFINDSDTLSQVYDSRNRLIHALLASGHPNTVRVCLIQNIRPAIPNSEDAVVIIPWDSLVTLFLDIFEQWPVLKGRAGNRLYATQISYLDAKGPIQLMDWLAGLF